MKVNIQYSICSILNIVCDYMRCFFTLTLLRTSSALIIIIMSNIYPVNSVSTLCIVLLSVSAEHFICDQRPCVYQLKIILEITDKITKDSVTLS